MFADLEAQYDAADASALAGEIADRSRRELVLVTVTDRLRACVGPVTLGLRGHAPVTGTVAAIGADWVLIAEGTVEVLVISAAVIWVRGLPFQAEPERSALAARLDLGYVLRGVARDRAGVRLLLNDGSAMTGTIDRVGRDFVDVAEHAPDEPRRADSVHSARTVPFGALVAVRRS
jgi:hypothetical protein